MRYLWEPFYQGKAEHAYQQAELFSPYLEHAGYCLNREEVREEAFLINSLYRYEEITASLLDEELWDGKYRQERNELLDILLHYLAWSDMKSGETQNGILVQFLEAELEGGHYGEKVQKYSKALSERQQRKLCSYLLRQQEAGSSLVLFEEVLTEFFPNAAVYKQIEQQKAILLYMGEEEREEAWNFVTGIEELFLPIGYRIRVFWLKHFGVIGSEETMQVGTVEIF